MVTWKREKGNYKIINIPFLEWLFDAKTISWERKKQTNDKHRNKERIQSTRKRRTNIFNRKIAAYLLAQTLTEYLWLKANKEKEKTGHGQFFRLSKMMYLAFCSELV